MPEVRGFKGYRYSADRISNFDDAITPPFDVISPEERTLLAAKGPYNMVHLILPVEKDGLNKYEAASGELDRWIEDKILRQDDEDSIYLLEQRFKDKDGADRVRRAFFAVVKLPEAGERTVLGHEQTFEYKIQDRLALTDATQANLGPVFLMYPDPKNELNPVLSVMDSRDPDYAAKTIDGVTQRVWRESFDPRIAEFFEQQTLYIADGHHRFATARAYRDLMREKEQPDGPRPYDYVLAGMVAFEDPGLLVYPAHRVLSLPNGADKEELRKRLSPYFEVEEVERAIERKVEAGSGPVLGIALPDNEQLLVRLKEDKREELLGTDHGASWRNLDVAVLHRGILERLLGVEQGTELIYEPDAEKALAASTAMEKGAVFFMNGATPEQIKACADDGEFMPQKATYIFPKLPTGAVIHRLR